MHGASRRRFLKAAGAAAGVLGGVTAWRAWDQGVFSPGDGPAYAPWKTWSVAGGEKSPSHLVRAAILAASPHNTQPWRFRVAPTRVDLFADPARNLGSLDPYRRELHIGLGCALENMVLAAAAQGFAPRTTLFPNGTDPTHVGRVDLTPGQALASALADAIPDRHTHRGPYDTSRPVGASVFEALQDLGSDLPQVTVKWFADPEARRRVGTLIVHATEAIVADPEQSRDSAAWFRGSWQEVHTKRDGLTVDAQALPPWMLVAAKMLPPVSPEQADRFWLKATREVHVATAAAYGLLLVRDATDNVQRIQGGRLWQRMHLWATAHGLAMQPLNQLPERADREASLGIPPRFGDALRDLVGDAAWHALMPFRMGYPTGPVLPSPRRSVEDVTLA